MAQSKPPKRVATTSIVVNETKQTPPKPIKQRNRRLRGVRPTPYLDALINPFNAPPVHIPDDNVATAGLVTTQLHLRLQPNAITGTGNVHNMAVILGSYPDYIVDQLFETSAGNGILTDVNALGTAYVGTQMAATNATSFYGGNPGSCKVRLVSLGCRVTYEGTELNRGGKITAGLCTNSSPLASVVTTGTQSSQASGYFTLINPTITNIRNSMSEAVESRVDDGIFDVHWEPNGVPTYQNFSSTKYSSTVVAGATTPAGTGPYQQEKGGSGPEIGQNALVILIENDVSSTAVVTGNYYDFSLIWNWEVIPDSPPLIIYSLTPSYCNFQWLQDAINTVQERSLGGYVGSAPSYGPSMTTLSKGQRAMTYFGRSFQNRASPGFRRLRTRVML